MEGVEEGMGLWRKDWMDNVVVVWRG